MPTAAWRKSHKRKMRKYRREWYFRNATKAKAKTTLRKKRLLAWFRELKSKLKCSRCSESHQACLDFHHRDPKTKEKEVAATVSNYGWAKERILKEIAKCIVLCANCHRKEHWDRIGRREQ